MGLFAKRNKSKSSSRSKFHNGSTTAPVVVDEPPKKQHDDEPPPEQRPQQQKRRASRKSVPVEEPMEINMEMVPHLMQDLEQCHDTSGDKPARALRMLFSLSEHANDSENRVLMTRHPNQGLVPTLLNFLQRCERGSSEQYLALLVLNNICIPSENKRWIAVECGGAHVFSRLLCEDPSCHLMAIILVNLTFCDAELRQELVTDSPFHVMESLSYALRVSSMTPQEYEAREHLLGVDGNSPRDLLAKLLEEDGRLRPALSNLDNNRGYNYRSAPFDPAKQLYPETARWCLCALKNLTRPSKDTTAARSLVQCGIVDLILKIVTVGGGGGGGWHHNRDMVTIEESENEASSPSTDSTPSPMDPLEQPPELTTNAPTTWDANSMQDAALFCVLNMCAVAREYMRELDAVHVLELITSYPHDEENEVLAFQSLKARMAMSYLLGSSGHFGQPQSRHSATTELYSSVNPSSDSVLLMAPVEIELLVELLANTLHRRAKEGPGGYSAATFNIKGVVLAIRCLLVHPLNQEGFGGGRLNVLLLQVLAQHAIMGNLDAETAQHACWSLYLQSNHGFQDLPFLPAIFGEHDKLSGKGSLTAKVLTSYLLKESITPAGRHAADQLLLRLRYLKFKGSVSELSSSMTGTAVFVPSDFAFDDQLLEATEQIIVEKRSHGARPKSEIFDCPILRSRAPKRGSQKASWENRALATEFPSALEAVKELSFGSTKVRHVDAIDDILIANNIASSANGEKTESYNYWWGWKDTAAAAPPPETRESFFSISSRETTSEPVSIFNAFRCGGPMLCGTDTTMK